MWGEDPALVSPVDLSLCSGNDPEPTVQADQLARADAQFLRDTGPGFHHIDVFSIKGLSYRLKNRLAAIERDTDAA
ncbi:hypothetical protein ACH4U5_26945 [Streptomyces sp. NPDC020858]|uniref:hypothetical protein n=1 Tax=Streptomyces sp. NPDC020858 TaxID=3365097 RepID=UPI0037941A9F